MGPLRCIRFRIPWKIVRGAGEPCSLRPGSRRLSGAGHQAFRPRCPREGRVRVRGTACSSTPSTLAVRQ